MKKIIIDIPKGIRYISEWDGFALPNEVCIIDKQITGCGFTEFCLTNNDNVILVSPRKILLENKEEQHKGEVFYATSGLENNIDFEKDFTGKPYSKSENNEFDGSKIKDELDKFKFRISGYYSICIVEHRPCKILVTYDSFRHVKDALGDDIKNFYVVVDEFQSILVDAKFKSSTEIEFLQHLNDISRISFVSATPMMDKYLGMLDEFKNLPFYELDWGKLDPSRITRPELQVRTYDSRGMFENVSNIIDKYKQGKFESRFREVDGITEEIQSKEAVFYINSVKSLCTIIRKNCLTLENTNVLCARNSSNEKDVRNAFNDSYKKLYPGDKSKLIPTKDSNKVIGKVPLEGQPHKMFTLCTRTVYLGADFYSTNARTFIFSDANIDSLTVDVSMDLEQILGRQRLDINPWKNSANLYIKLQVTQKTREDFEKELDIKKTRTESLLRSYSRSLDSDKHNLAETYQYVAKTANYKDNYVAVNTHCGSDLVPVFNNLMLVSEQRTFEIQQVDYKDRFTIFSAMDGSNYNVVSNDKVNLCLENFEYLKTFTDKMKYVDTVHDSILDENDFLMFLNNLPSEYINYINVLGFDEIRSCSYQRSKIISKLSKKSSTKEDLEKIKEDIIDSFKIGEKYTKSFIKETLKSIYEDNGYGRTPKASDLENYLETKECLINNKETGKRDAGLEILKLKI